MNRSTRAALGVFALLLSTPALASAELVWRAPLVQGEAALQIESFDDRVVVTRPDGYQVSLSGFSADRNGAAFCAHDGVSYLALGVSGTSGDDIWVWNASTGSGRLVPLPAKLASRPTANTHCAFAFTTIDGALGVIDVPAGSDIAWTPGALTPLDDPMEHPGGLMLAAHGEGWIVGEAGAAVNMVVGEDVSAAEVDSTLRPGAVSTEDGTTWTLSRRGGLYVFDTSYVPKRIARDRVASSTRLVRWPGVGVAWGNALGELVVHDGVELRRIPLSQRALDRGLITSTSSEGSVALVPTADGWLYTVDANLDWTRTPHQAPLRGPALTVEPAGVLLPGRRTALKLVDLTEPVAHLEDSVQSEHFQDPTRALSGHVMTSTGLELLDGVPVVTLAKLEAPELEPEPPIDEPSPGQIIDDANTGANADANEQDMNDVALGCSATATQRAPSPLGLALLFGMLLGLRRRRGTHSAWT